jgi:magnesium-transporting ATPase (P-type)
MFPHAPPIAATRLLMRVMLAAIVGACTLVTGLPFLRGDWRTLIERVEEAQEARAPIQTIGERFSARFVPASFVLSAIVLLATGDLRRALTMLLVACPRASGLATPTAVSAAIGNGARRGILIKGGRPLEIAAHVDAMVFDKTGTLTTGNPTVARVIATADDKYRPSRCCQSLRTPSCTRSIRSSDPCMGSAGPRQHVQSFIWVTAGEPAMSAEEQHAVDD